MNKGIFQVLVKKRVTIVTLFCDYKGNLIRSYLWIYVVIKSKLYDIECTNKINEYKFKSVKKGKYISFRLKGKALSLKYKV